MIGVIYKVTNIVSGKMYIGQTIKDSNYRKQQHIRASFNEKHSSFNYPLQRAIRKYGIQSFKWEILKSGVLTVDDLNEAEIEHIKQCSSFKAGYNSCLGGKSNSGYIHSDESKRRMSESKKSMFASGEWVPPFLGKRHTEKAKTKMSDSARGKKISQATREKISKANKGRPSKLRGRSLSESHKQKISASLVGRVGHKYWLGKKHTEETKIKMISAAAVFAKPVLQYDIDGKFIQKHDSIKAATRYVRSNTKYHKATKQNIKKCCKGLCKSVYGYGWQLE